MNMVLNIQALVNDEACYERVRNKVGLKRRIAPDDGAATERDGEKNTGEIECDAAHINKGHATAVARAGRKGRCRGLKGAAQQKPPIFGMIQRSDEMVIHMLENVKQTTIKPAIPATVKPGTRVYNGREKPVLHSLVAALAG